MITIKHSCKRGLWSVQYIHIGFALKLLLIARSQRIKQGLLNNAFRLEFCGFCSMLYMCISIYYVVYWTFENYH